MANAIQLHLVLWFWAIQWKDALEILTWNAGTNNYVFGAIFRILLPLISKNKVVRQIAGFWMINSLFGNFYAIILWVL
jgi:hydrogenase-4 membrane subunit HyfE